MSAINNIIPFSIALVKFAGFSSDALTNGAETNLKKMYTRYGSTDCQVIRRDTKLDRYFPKINILKVLCV